MSLKTCTKCHRVLPLHRFDHRGKCKDCRAEYMIEYKQRKKEEKGTLFLKEELENKEHADALRIYREKVKQQISL